jgi:hypothetical protein
MKNLIILLIAFMVFSCSNEVSGVEQEPVFEVFDTCDYVKHCETLPPASRNTTTENFFNKSMEELDSAKALVERVNDIGLVKCEIVQVECR